MNRKEDGLYAIFVNKPIKERNLKFEPGVGAKSRKRNLSIQDDFVLDDGNKWCAIQMIGSKIVHARDWFVCELTVMMVAIVNYFEWGLMSLVPKDDGNVQYFEHLLKENYKKILSIDKNYIALSLITQNM